MVPNLVSSPVKMTEKPENYNSYCFLYTASNFQRQTWYTIIARTCSVEKKHEIKHWLKNITMFS